MHYVITDARGKRVGQPFDDRVAMRAAGKLHVLSNGGAVMVWFADANGVQLGYSSEDTAAITKAVGIARSKAR